MPIAYTSENALTVGCPELLREIAWIVKAERERRNSKPIDFEEQRNRGESRPVKYQCHDKGRGWHSEFNEGILQKKTASICSWLQRLRISQH